MSSFERIARYRCLISPDPLISSYSLYVFYNSWCYILQVDILPLYSIFPDPFTGCHYLSVFYISWSSFKFSFSVCILYLMFLLQVLILCLCSLSPDPITGSHSLSLFYVIGSGDNEHRQRMITCTNIRRYRIHTDKESGDMEYRESSWTSIRIRRYRIDTDDENM
jgi:hypothetical protein